MSIALGRGLVVIGEDNISTLGAAAEDARLEVLIITGWTAIPKSVGTIEELVETAALIGTGSATVREEARRDVASGMAVVVDGSWTDIDGPVAVEGARCVKRPVNVGADDDDEVCDPEEKCCSNIEIIRLWVEPLAFPPADVEASVLDEDVVNKDEEVVVVVVVEVVVVAVVEAVVFASFSSGI